MRDERPTAVAHSTGFHRPFDPSLDLQGPELGMEESGGLALEEPFEEPLDGGKGSHGEAGL
jgi:hypothetical protein